MFIRKLQREIAVVAIAACAPLVFGCASTNRYVVDPDLSPSAEFVAFKTYRDRTTFAAEAGAIDAAAMTITGVSVHGDSVTVRLDKVQQLYIRARTQNHDTIDAKPDALLAGANWRPQGQCQDVALQTGEVMDARKIPMALDATARAVLFATADSPASVIPFDEILYVQTRDAHPERTALCVIGLVILASLTAAAIAMSQDDFSILGDGEW